MKRYLMVFSLAFIVFTQSMSIASQNDGQSVKNGWCARATLLAGTVGAGWLGAVGATEALAHITPEKLGKLIEYTPGKGSVAQAVSTFLKNNKDALIDPSVWGTLGAVTAGSVAAYYVYSITPAGCIKEYKKLFGLQENTWKNFNRMNAEILIADAKANGWPLLGLRTYEYHKVAEYLARLSFRCTIAKALFGHEDIKHCINSLENMKALIINSRMYKNETQQMSLKAQEKVANAAQLAVVAQHKDDLFGLAKSMIVSTLWDYSGTGLCVLGAAALAYKYS